MQTTKLAAGSLEVRPSSKPGNGTGWRDIVCVRETGDQPYVPYYVGEALEENAVLFAAAPDLLEACEAALRVVNWPDNSTTRQQLEDAAAKARG